MRVINAEHGLLVQIAALECCLSGKRMIDMEHRVKSLREQIANGRTLSSSQMQTLQNLSTQLPAETQQTILKLLTEQMGQK